MKLRHFLWAVFLVLAAAFCISLATAPASALAQTATGSYVETPTGNTKAAVGVSPVLGTVWSYSPPTGGYLNSTTAVAIKGAAGAGISNYITGGECWSEPLTNATEITILDGGTVVWRMKVPTAGWTVAVDINFVPYIKGTANTALLFQGLTASGAGAIYCDWRGGTSQ